MLPRGGRTARTRAMEGPLSGIAALLSYPAQCEIHRDVKRMSACFQLFDKIVLSTKHDLFFFVFALDAGRSIYASITCSIAEVIETLLFRLSKLQ